VLIAFDGVCLADGNITGVGRAFLDGLAAYAAGGYAHCVLLLPRAAPDPDLPGVRIVEAPSGALRRQRQLPRLLRALGADVLHSSVAAVPLAAACATIATVHDLPWLADGYRERTSAWRRFATTRALRSASAVIAPSTFTRDAAARLCDRNKISVVPHGSERCALPSAGGDRTGPLLVLGDDRPRKNRTRVRQAHEAARRQLPTLPPLRFVGPPDAWVDEPTKHDLLRTCTAVVQASLFEGFGLPVLEALAHAAPLVCADIPPFREIAADAACYVDPRDPASIAAGLVRVADPALRAELAQHGHARAAAFSPAATARHWATLHREVAR
jgi:glycosyltransferase involved in cell wall biosynthesis